jgi:NAD/NADP transhydrogenase beta subunit
VESQYIVTGVVVALVLGFLLARREHVWHRSPGRFWTIPVLGAFAILVAVPASDLERPAEVALLIVGALVGLGIGAARGQARFTEVSADPDGKIAYRPNMLGLAAIVVVLALHYVANLIGDAVSGLQLVLTALLTLGVGETFGWHGAVFLRWRRLRDSDADADAQGSTTPDR